MSTFDFFPWMSHFAFLTHAWFWRGAVYSARIVLLESFARQYTFRRLRSAPVRVVMSETDFSFCRNVAYLLLWNFIRSLRTVSSDRSIAPLYLFRNFRSVRVAFVILTFDFLRRHSCHIAECHMLIQILQRQKILHALSGIAKTVHIISVPTPYLKCQLSFALTLHRTWHVGIIIPIHNFRHSATSAFTGLVTPRFTYMLDVHSLPTYLLPEHYPWTYKMRGFLHSQHSWCTQRFLHICC